MRFDELDRRQHFAVPRRLEKPDVFGIRVEHIHRVEVDALPGELPAQVPRDDEIGDDARSGRSSEGRTCRPDADPDWPS